MTRFQVITEKHDTDTFYKLTDTATGARARVLPSFGANVVELCLPAGDDGDVIPVIDDFKLVHKLKEQPSRYGIPILAPWPSGITDAEFMFEGQLHQLNEPGVSRPRPHGFVMTAKWTVLRSDCDNSAAWVTCAIDSNDCGDIATRYPSQFTLEITFRLAVDGFRIGMLVRNTGQKNMPFGLGLHPYFSIPFGVSGTLAQCRLAADVKRQWDIGVTVPFKAGAAAPERVFLPEPAFPIGSNDGIALDDKRLNEVYEARFPGETTTARLIDPADRAALAVTASEGFGTWVFYTPPDREVVSLEPWTLTPNGFNLAAAGLDNTGTIIVSPGRDWRGHVSITLESQAN